MRSVASVGSRTAFLLLMAGAASSSAQLAPVCQTFDFQDGTLQGFTTELLFGASPLWHNENNVCRAELAGHTTPNTLYYGQTFDVCNYNTGERNASNAVSPAIPLDGLEAPFTVDFNYLLFVEGGGFDTVFVDVSADGVSWVQVASKTNLINDNQWHAATTLDVSPQFDGSTTGYVRFRFDTIDSIANATTGWHVDDIVVCGAPVISVLEIPTLSRAGLLLLALATAAFAVLVLRRR